MRVEKQHERNDCVLESSDGRHRFEIFIRQSIVFEENFSIGLRYLPSDEPRSFVLVRCNGQHGGHNVFPHHAHYHVHRVKAHELNHGNDMEESAEITSEYALLPDALAYFCRLINLIDARDYFPQLNDQWTLFAEPRDNKSKARLATIACLEFQKKNLSFKSLIVHEDFDRIPQKDRKRLTNACDKQFTSLTEFKENIFEYLSRERY